MIVQFNINHKFIYLARLTERIIKGISVEPMIKINTQSLASSVLYIANLPLKTNVLFHTVMATKMPFVGVGAS